MRTIPQNPAGILCQPARALKQNPTNRGVLWRQIIYDIIWPRQPRKCKFCKVDTKVWYLYHTWGAKILPRQNFVVKPGLAHRKQLFGISKLLFVACTILWVLYNLFCCTAQRAIVRRYPVQVL